MLYAEKDTFWVLRPNLTRQTFTNTDPVQDNETLWWNTQGRFAAAYLYRWLTKGLIAMANRNKPATWTQITFVDFSLDRSDEKAYNKWAIENEKRLGDMLDDVLADNYKISISPDFRNACTIITLTCKNPDSPNADCAFSTRAELWLDAMLMAMYKHFELAHGGEWPTDKGSRAWG